MIDEYIINAATLRPTDVNSSNDTLIKETYVDTMIVHIWDDDEANGSIVAPYPFNNSMQAVKFTSLAPNFTILSGDIYIEDISGDGNGYAEFEWVKICPDVSGAPDLDNAFGTINNIGTYESAVPILMPIDITDVLVTSYTGDLWIVTKNWDGVDDFLAIGTDNENPDGNSYYSSGTLPSWQQMTNSDLMMRLNINYYPCGVSFAYEYLPGDANMYNGVWPPTVIGGDVTYLVNYFRGMLSSHPCLLDGFWASADINGDCNVIGSDVTKLVSFFRGVGTILWCPEYEPAWQSSGDLPGSAPSGWPNCGTLNTIMGTYTIPTKTSK